MKGNGETGGRGENKNYPWLIFKKDFIRISVVHRLDSLSEHN